MARQPIPRIRSTGQAWSIETGLTKPQHLLRSVGALTAVYLTRRAAREQLEVLKLTYRLPRAARAVRVKVSVTTIGRG